MPTGYTAKLCERDQLFEEFVMQCTRAMGATITMRDEPLDAPIPDAFSPHTDYHDEKIRNAKEMISVANDFTDEVLRAKARADFRKRRQELKSEIQKRTKVRNRLCDMKSKVEEWIAPSNDHEGLKKFMLEQLDSTIQFDGDATRYEKQLKELRVLEPDELKEKIISEATHEIQYHTKALEEEIERVNQRNNWISLLRESLKPKAA